MKDKPDVKSEKKEENTNKESHIRSVVKGVTWRILGTLDTIFLSWLITGSVKFALAIGGTEIFTKIILFYFHERLWQLVPRGTFRKFFKKKGN